MEALPKVALMSFQLKVSPEATNFPPKLKQYICDVYNEDPAFYINDFVQLEKLRSAAIRPTMDAAGLAALYKYFGQLKAIQKRFPMAKGQPAAVAFVWKDLFNNHAISHSDIKYELACILYNIGAMHTIFAESESRSTPESLKATCTHLQKASWAFQQLRDQYPQPSGTDVSDEFMKLFQEICSAQAQECIMEKSIQDSKKASVIGAIAVQVMKFYLNCMAILGPSAGPDSIYEAFGTKLYNVYYRYLAFKVAYTGTIVSLYQGIMAEELQKMGERVAFFQLALGRLEDARKMAKYVEPVDETQEVLTFLNDVVEGKRKAAKNENEFIYHEEVPAKELLTELKPVCLVKPIQINLTEEEVIGPELFLTLIPMDAHASASIYSEEKAKLLREVVSLVEDKNMELSEFMSSLQLDHLEVLQQVETTPQEIVDRCASMNAKTDVIPTLTESMNGLAEIISEVEHGLDEINNIMQAEIAKEKEYQKMIGHRPPSIMQTELLREYNKYRDAHNRTNESNQVLHKAMMLHIANLKLLCLPLDELQKKLPSIDNIDGLDRNTMAEMRRVVEKTREMQTQRENLVKELREQLTKDDITSQLISCGADFVPEVCKEGLKKHNNQVTLIKLNMSAQENIINKLTSIYASYGESRRLLAEVMRKRESLINALITSYDTHEELRGKSQKGLDFYKRMNQNVSQLLSRVKSTCQVQEEERSQLLAKQGPKVSTVPQAAKVLNNAPIPASVGSTPKLKDYLPYMKNRTYPVPVAGQPDNVQESYNFDNTFPTSARPAPVGSETVDSSQVKFPDGYLRTASHTYVNYMNDTNIPENYYPPVNRINLSSNPTPEASVNYNTASTANPSINPYYANPQDSQVPNYANPQNTQTPNYTNPQAPNYTNPQNPQTSNYTNPQNPQISNYTNSQNPQAPNYTNPQNPQASNYVNPQNPQASNYTNPQNPQTSNYMNPQNPQTSNYMNPQNPQTSNYMNPLNPQTSNYTNPQVSTSNDAQIPQYTPNQSQDQYNVYAVPNPPVPSFAPGSTTNTISSQDLSGSFSQMQLNKPEQPKFGPEYTQNYYMQYMQNTAPIPNASQSSQIAPSNAPFQYPQTPTPQPQVVPQYPQTTNTNLSYNPQMQQYPAPANVSYMEQSVPTATPSQVSVDYNNYNNQTVNPTFSTDSYTSFNQSYPTYTMANTSDPFSSTTSVTSVSSNPLGEPYQTVPSHDMPIKSHTTGEATSAYQFQAYNNAVAPNATQDIPQNYASTYQTYQNHPGYMFNASTGIYEYNYGSQNSYVSYSGNQPLDQNNMYSQQGTYTNAGNYQTVQSPSENQQVPQMGEQKSQAYYSSPPYGLQTQNQTVPEVSYNVQVTNNTSYPGNQSTYMQSGQVGDTNVTYTNQVTKKNVHAPATVPEPQPVQPEVEKPETPKTEPKPDDNQTVPVVQEANIKEPSAFDLLSDIDFNCTQINETPLLPQIKVPQANENILKKGPGPVKKESLKRIYVRPEREDWVKKPELMAKFNLQTKEFLQFTHSCDKDTNIIQDLFKKYKVYTENEEKTRPKNTSLENCNPQSTDGIFVGPFDDSRLLLDSDPTAYINATYYEQLTPWCVPLVISRWPSNAEQNIFWRAIFEKKITAVVCMVRELEMTPKDLPHYWPQTVGDSLQIAGLRITLSDEKCRMHYNERKLQVFDGKKTHAVTHFQITSNPGIMSCLPLITLASSVLEITYKCKQPNDLQCVWVHDQYGNGRSGVFALLLSTMCDVRAGQTELKLNFENGCLELIKNRINVIEDSNMLFEAYKTVLFYAQSVICAGTNEFDGTYHSPNIAVKNPEAIPEPKEERKENRSRPFEIKSVPYNNAGYIKDPLNHLDPLWSLKKKDK